MASFYGGPKGQDFKIKEVFHEISKLEEDAGKSDSNILIGEYVLTDLSANNILDENNLTIWEKIYKTFPKIKAENGELVDIGDNTDISGYLEEETPSGKKRLKLLPTVKTTTNIYYKKIAKIPFPTLNLKIAPDKIDPGAFETTEDVIVPETGATDLNYIYTLKLPKAWDFEGGTITYNKNPGDYNAKGIADLTTKHETEPNSIKVLNLEMPKMWDFIAGDISYDIDPGAVSGSTVANGCTIENSDGETSTSIKKINMHLPKPWDFKGSIITEYTDPYWIEHKDVNNSPKISIEEIKEDTKKRQVSLKLPQPYQIKPILGNSVLAGEAPKITSQGIVNDDEKQQSYQQIEFSLPAAWVPSFNIATTNTLRPNSSPEISETPILKDGKAKFELAFPPNWDIESAISISSISSGSKPTGIINNNNNNTKKIIKLNLPKPWGIKTDESSLHFITPQENYSNIAKEEDKPHITVESKHDETAEEPYKDYKQLHFYLPKPWGVLASIGDNLSPLESPKVSEPQTIEGNKKFTFQFPRNGKFFFGELNYNRGEPSLDKLPSTCLPGDYFINSPTGQIYYVEGTTEKKILTYKGTLKGKPVTLWENSVIYNITGSETNLDQSIIDSFAETINNTDFARDGSNILNCTIYESDKKTIRENRQYWKVGDKWSFIKVASGSGNSYWGEFF